MTSRFVGLISVMYLQNFLAKIQWIAFEDKLYANHSKIFLYVTQGRLISYCRLDYAGIAILTIGSFVPYLYYTFYCDFSAMVGYLSLICVLGVTTICVSTLDVFASPRFRPVRAGSFIGLGLSGVIPATHYAAVVGWNSAVEDGSLGWLIIMAVLYISGAVLYALRVPERCFPGYCDIWVCRQTRVCVSFCVLWTA